MVSTVVGDPLVTDQRPPHCAGASFVHSYVCASHPAHIHSRTTTRGSSFSSAMIRQSCSCSMSPSRVSSPDEPRTHEGPPTPAGARVGGLPRYGRTAVRLTVR